MTAEWTLGRFLIVVNLVLVCGFLLGLPSGMRWCEAHFEVGSYARSK